MGLPNDLPTSATLQVTPELVAGLNRECTALDEARDFVIDSQQMAVAANTMLQDVKKRYRAVEEWDERFAAPIRQLEDTRKALFGPAKEALLKAETHIKGLLKSWTEQEDRRIAEEKRQAEETARRAREQAARDAAAARARAEEQARVAREKAAAAEAERNRAAAEAERLRSEGNAKAAAEEDRKAKAAAAEQAKREEEERQRKEAGEREAQRLQLEAAARTYNMPQTAPAPKLAGFGTRKNWIAELAPDTTEDQAQERIVRVIAGIAPDAPLARMDLLKLIPLDMKEAGRLARAQEQRFNVPGLIARNDPIASSSSKKG